MKTQLTLILAAGLLFVPSLPAQDGDMPDMSPAKEVAKLEMLVGTWIGRGKAWSEPGAEPMAWTATSTAKKVLGGHAIRTDDEIDLGEGAPGKLKFRNLKTWDRENHHYLELAIGNDGEANVSRLDFVDGNSLMSVTAKIADGKPTTERWITKFDGDTMSVTGYKAIGTGKEFLYVQGTYKRTAKSGAWIDASTPFMPGAPNAEMTRLARMAGNYKFAGGFIMTPGAPEMKISGSESFTTIFGGHAMEILVKGDPIPGMEGMPNYEAWAALAWDATKNCYTQIYANNMGECSHGELRWVANTLVGTMSGMQRGKYSQLRSVMYANDAGVMTKADGHAMIGTAAPYKSFWATYTKQ